MALPFCLTLYALSSFASAAAGMVSIFFLATILLGSVEVWRETATNGWHKLSTPIFLKVGLLLYFWIFSSAAWSEADLEFLVEQALEYRFFLVFPILFYIAQMAYLRLRMTLLSPIIGFILTSSIVIAYGVFGHDFSLGPFSFKGRIFSGFALNIGLAANLILIVRARSSLGEFNFRLISLIVLLVTAVTVFFYLNSRTAYVGYILIAGAFLIRNMFHQDDRKTGAFFIAFSVFVFISFSGDFWDRVRTTSQDFFVLAGAGFSTKEIPSTSIGERYHFYEIGVKETRDRLLYGQGLGGAPQELDRLWRQGILRFQTDNLHSEYLSIFFSFGLIGLILFLLWWFYFFIFIRKGLEVTDYYHIVAASFAYILIHFLFHSGVKDFGEKNLLLSFFCFILILIKIEARDAERKNFG